jgi:hypothetical protein
MAEEAKVFALGCDDAPSYPRNVERGVGASMSEQEVGTDNDVIIAKNNQVTLSDPNADVSG